MSSWQWSWGLHITSSVGFLVCDYHQSCLTHIQEQMIPPRPLHKIAHMCSALLLLHIANTSHHCRSSVYFCRRRDLELHFKSEVNRNGYCTAPLWPSCTAHHQIRQAVAPVSHTVICLSGSQQSMRRFTCILMFPLASPSVPVVVACLRHSVYSPYCLDRSKASAS